MAETKRRFFQIHLSTCIVLLFVAGGLVWANVWGGYEYGSLSGHYGWIYVGWPCYSGFYYGFYCKQYGYMSPFQKGFELSGEYGWSRVEVVGISIDCATALIILF